MPARLRQERENGSALEVVLNDDELAMIVEALAHDSQVLETGAGNFKESVDIKVHLLQKSRKLAEMSQVIKLLIGS